MIVTLVTCWAEPPGLVGMDVWGEVASLITIMVLGHWLEMRAITQARGALNAIAALLPNTSERINGVEVQTVPLAQLDVGDIVLVRPGIRVPADGVVVEGTAEIDEPMLTGESREVSKGPAATGSPGTDA